MENLSLNLQLFGEDGGGAPAAADGGQTQTQAQNDQGQPAAEAQPQKMSFRDLLKSDPEYSAEYKKSVQEHVGRRMKATEAGMQRLSALEPVAERLAKIYGVDSQDPAALLSAIENDDRYYEEQALAAGMDVGTYKQLEQSNRKIEMLQRQVEANRRNEEARRIHAKWAQESEAMREIYPDFDFDSEMEDDNFARLLRAGVPVRHAYEVAHHDQIMGAGMAYAVQRTAAQVANDVRARGMRPAENGAGNGAGSVTRGLKVADMTEKDILRIAAKAKRGEKTKLS